MTVSTDENDFKIQLKAATGLTLNLDFAHTVLQGKHVIMKLTRRMSQKIQ